MKMQCKNDYASYEYADEVTDATPQSVIILWLSYWLAKLKIIEQNSVYLSFQIQHHEITPDTVGHKINGSRLDCLCNQLCTKILPLSYMQWKIENPN